MTEGDAMNDLPRVMRYATFCWACWAVFALGALAQEELPVPAEPVVAIEAELPQKIVATRDALANGRALRAALRPGVVLQLTPGIYDIGDQRLTFPPFAVVFGPHRPAAVQLVSSARRSAEGCVFELWDGVQLKRLTLDCRSRVLDAKGRPDLGAQNQVVGMANGQKNCHASLEDVAVKGRSFGIYVWALAGNTIDGLRVSVDVGRWGVTAGGGADGSNSQTLRFKDSTISCDFDAFRGAGGSIGDGAVCLVARGGKIEFNGGSLTARGSALVDAQGRPYIDKTYAAWTTWQGSPKPYPGGPDWPAIRISKETTIQVDGNGSSDVQETRAQIGIIER